MSDDQIKGYFIEYLKEFRQEPRVRWASLVFPNHKNIMEFSKEEIKRISPIILRTPSEVNQVKRLISEKAAHEDTTEDEKNRLNTVLKDL